MAMSLYNSNFEQAQYLDICNATYAYMQFKDIAAFSSKPRWSRMIWYSNEALWASCDVKVQRHLCVGVFVQLHTTLLPCF